MSQKRVHVLVHRGPSAGGSAQLVKVPVSGGTKALLKAAAQKLKLKAAVCKTAVLHRAADGSTVGTRAPEFGGRKWVSKVRDWPSQNGVFGFG